MLITCVKSNDTTNTVEDLKFTGILQNDLNCYIAPSGFLVPKYPIVRMEQELDSDRDEDDRSFVKPVKKSKKIVNAQQFIDAEADLSDNGLLLSDDEIDNSQLNAFDSSFINDESACVQNDSTKGDNETMMYLQSVRNPRQGKFKLQFNPSNELEIYSQIPEDDDDSYENDSFCVDNTLVVVSNQPRTLYESPSNNVSTEVTRKSSENLSAIISKSVNMNREERLKLQKTKREEYLRKRAKLSNSQGFSIANNIQENTPSVNPCNTSKRNNIIKTDSKSSGSVSQTVPKTSFDTNDKKKDHNFTRTMNSGITEIKSNLDCNTDQSTSRISLFNQSLQCNNKSPVNYQKKDLVVIVDSREIGASQNIVSTLKSKYSVKITVHQLATSDYILSNRVAVDRKTYSEFCNSANKKKLIDRIRYMCELFDRPYIIIEKDRIKNKETERKLTRSKYLNSMLAYLAQTHIKVLYSESSENSAYLIHSITVQELKKGMNIKVSLELSSSQEKLCILYQSLPRISYISAVNLLNGFSSFKDICDSSVETLKSKGGLSHSRAEEVYSYLRRTFNPDMLPS
ncbi:Fanconi anemia group M protein [Nymphon striatum]|nr:Fanconi anemia group M protein [Nymphon striatum]